MPTESETETYELLSKLGEGWAGETWLASLRHLRFGLPAGAHVALKRYKPAIFKQALNIAERIEREAKLGATVCHENLIRVYGLEKLESPDGGEVWALVMELCTGGDLARWISNHYPLSGSDTLHIATGLADGLTRLHSAGVTHRDVKPENVLMWDNGTPKIGDFGVIRHVDEATMTGSAEFLGTIRYAAPEVLKGEGATQASDMYSLGTVLYQLLYGRRPYDEHEMFAVVVAAVIAGPPSMPSAADRFGSEISPQHLIVESVCKRLLSAAPTERPLAAVVHKWLRDERCEPLLDDVTEVLRPIVNEHIHEWANAAGVRPTIFTTFTAWRLARAMTVADAVEVLRTRSAALIERSSKYMAIAVAHIPTPETYLELPRDARVALARALRRHQKPYVREIWDDRSEMANRDASYLGLVHKFLEIEPDREIQDVLRSMRYCTPWVDAGPPDPFQ